MKLYIQLFKPHGKKLFQSTKVHLHLHVNSPVCNSKSTSLAANISLSKSKACDHPVEKLLVFLKGEFISIVYNYMIDIQQSLFSDVFF